VLAGGIGATRKQRRVSPHPPPALLGALAFGAPACGAFAPGRRRPQAGLPVALRSAPQADGRCTQDPRRHVGATVAPAATARAPRPARSRPSSTASARGWRPGRRRQHSQAQPRRPERACRAGCHAGCTSRMASRVLHAPAEVYRGGEAPPRDPPPPCAGGSRAVAPAAGPCPPRPGRPRRSPWREERQGSQRSRPALSAHGLEPRTGRAGQRFSLAAPGWGAVVRPAAAPGLASRPLLVPAAAGRRTPHCPLRRVRDGGAARTTGRAAPGLHRGHGTSCGPSVRPVPAVRPVSRPAPPVARDGGRHRKTASKGGLVPPWTPRPSACGARPGALRPGPGQRLTGRRHAGAGVLPAAHRWRHGRRPVLRAVRSSCSGMTVGASARAAGADWRRQPRSLRCAPPGGGRLRRGFDTANPHRQALEVAAARCARRLFPLVRESTGRTKSGCV